MKIAQTKATESITQLHSFTPGSIGLSDPADTMVSVTEDQTLQNTSFFAATKPEQYILLLTAYRILWDKYHFSSAPLTCRTKLTKIDPSGSVADNEIIFEERIDFKETPSKSTTCKIAFLETQKIFGKLQSLIDQFTESECYEFSMIALNPETGNIELDCTIRINHDLYFTFKAPHDSQFSEVVASSEHHFLKIINTIQQNPETVLADIYILTPEESDDLIRWSMGEYDPAQCEPSCLHHLFEQTTRKYPDLPAVYASGQNFSYREIDRKAGQLAGYLIRNGIRKGDYCGILLPRTEDMYIAMLAVLKSGAAYIPMDVSIPKDRLSFILNDSQSKLLITHSRFREKYDDLKCLKTVIDEEAAFISATETHVYDLNIQHPAPEDTAYIIYTSGTTGTPKGVKIQHAAIVNLVRAEANIFRVTSKDKVFQGFSISFDASLEEIWLAFFSGAQLFAGSEETVQSGSQIAAYINKHQLTVFSTVPTLLATITEDLPSVRTLILGGEACSMDLVRKWSTEQRRMVNTYGPTETTVIATYADCKPDRKVTIGRPVTNYSAYVLDANQKIVPYGIAGELCIGGMSLAEGYINNPSLSGSKFFVPAFGMNPDFPKRLYRSGDLVKYNQWGEIEFLGRIDSQVKLRGFRIELAEIESQLLKQEGIQNCALTIKKDQGGLEHLVAYVVVRNQHNFDPLAIKKELRTKLAPYMVPSRFEVINEIPLLASGKIDRNRLPEPHFQQESLLNNTETESTIDNITRLWEAIFGMGNISPRDNFFELGGHSLLASQMISILRKDIRYEQLSVKDVYNHPTIEKLTHFIDHPPKAKKEPGKSPNHPNPTIKKTNRLTYLTVGFLQFLTTIFLYGVTACILLIPVILKNLLAEITTTELIISVLGSFVFFYFFWMTLSILAKWTIIGKFKEGSYPLWGFYYFRFWLVKKFVDMTPLNLMAGTPFIVWYFRLLGAKIGKNCYLGTDRLRAFDLISIGEDTSLLKESTLLGYKIENEILHIGNITVGNRCMVGARSLLGLNAVMQDDAMLLELSMLNEHDTIPKGEVWKGSPACPYQNRHTYLKQSKKHYTGIKKMLFRLVQGVALIFVLSFPQLLAAPFALLYYRILTHDGLYALLIASIPLVAIFIVLFCLSISAFKWILIGKQKPREIPLDSMLYLRKWIVDALTFMSLTFFRAIYATLYLPKWLRTTGVKVGKRAEISTLNHLSTDLLEIGNESFLADSTSIGVPLTYLGTMYLKNTHIGDRSFIGNSAVLIPGSKIGNDCLIGVLSTAPVSDDDQKINGSSWLGSPPIYLPNRQESPKFSDKHTFHPPWYLYIVRGSIEFFKITLPYAIASWLIILFYQIIYPLQMKESLTFLIIVATFLFTALNYATMIFGLAAKWGLIGRYVQTARPLWSTFVWRNELINAITECLIFPLYQNMVLGTPLAPVFFRMMGCKIGRRVYMETTEITEFDLVHIQSGAALNFGSTMQTHLFEDRVMKMSTVDIGKNCTVGAMSVVLYDSKMGHHATLDGLSLLMKGETLPACTKWQGSPSDRIN